MTRHTYHRQAWGVSNKDGTTPLPKPRRQPPLPRTPGAWANGSTARRQLSSSVTTLRHGRYLSTLRSPRPSRVAAIPQLVDHIDQRCCSVSKQASPADWLPTCAAGERPRSRRAARMEAITRLERALAIGEEAVELTIGPQANKGAQRLHLLGS